MDRMTLLERELEPLRGKLAKIDAENNILSWELASEISQAKHLEQMLNEAKDDLARVTAERDAAIAYMRKISWCAGCINFLGLGGCKDSLLEVCGKYHDYYQFRGKGNDA